VSMNADAVAKAIGSSGEAQARAILGNNAVSILRLTEI
jgi:hypothetical protein